MSRRKPKAGSGRDELGQLIPGCKSLNPRGRKGKRDDRSDIINSILSMADAEFSEFAQRPDLTKAERLVLRALQETEQGNTAMLKEMLDRGFGKVTDKLQIIEDAIIDIEGEDD